MTVNANRGYVGWSMSVRAEQAYESGEMPKSKWTKQAMLAAIHDWLDDHHIQLTDKQARNLSKLPRMVMFENLFCASSWHHTSKQFNKTDFYALDADALRALIDEDATFEADWILLVRGERQLRHFATRAERDAWYAEHGCQSDNCQRDGFARKAVHVK
ncbi:hypothetical protein PG2000B_1072 [Bifidobacterium pseudolongum subsp. globosum]|uniref:hypothetical protein n=1 Tax=Bifidobacterium pseudolongum TaxID=1694 RepID=UPI0010212AF5|nr:hypothetical protein [Bifidobacterium pseudolongum]RYQ42379.1 hypothetical protein PG2000B_1072 [Bifidobacterium pseudolongum subsp. globosum]